MPNKTSKIGRTIICKQCLKKVIAHAWNQAFCCNECKDVYYEKKWNIKCATKHGKREKTKCELCGYGKYDKCLEWHHVFSDEKNFNLHDWAKHTPEENEIEYEKCVLLCCNCHNEIHRGRPETTKAVIGIIESRRSNMKK